MYSGLCRQRWCSREGRRRTSWCSGSRVQGGITTPAWRISTRPAELGAQLPAGFTGARWALRFRSGVDHWGQQDVVNPVPGQAQRLMSFGLDTNTDRKCGCSVSSSKPPTTVAAPSIAMWRIQQRRPRCRPPERNSRLQHIYPSG